MKSSLAPGSRVVTDYYERSGLQRYLDELGFNTVGYGCTTCIGNSGPLHRRSRRRSHDGDLVACAVLSGNRNFEARIHPEVKANYLASPPLVVAYALAGPMDIDLDTEPLGQGRTASTSTCATSGRRSTEIQEVIAVVDPRRHVPRHLRRRLHRRRDLAQRCRFPKASSSRGRTISTYVRRPTVLRGHAARARRRHRHRRGARCLVSLGDSVTTDHISPAGLDQARLARRRLPDRARRRARGLQLVRRAARQPRGDGARHVRERAAAATSSCPAPRERGRCTCRAARR